MSESRCPSCRELEREMKRQQDAWAIEKRQLLRAIHRESEIGQMDTRTKKTAQG